MFTLNKLYFYLLTATAVLTKGNTKIFLLVRTFYLFSTQAEVPQGSDAGPPLSAKFLNDL